MVLSCVGVWGVFGFKMALNKGIDLKQMCRDTNKNKLRKPKPLPDTHTRALLNNSFGSFIFK